jgi:RsiW-degrading membrane proteinase PrsW (M82 family)
LFRPREPAFWVFVAILFGTLLLLVAEQRVFLRISGSGWVLAWILALAYAAPVLLLVYALDLFEKEPVSLIAGAVLWGALASAALAGIANGGWALVVARLGGPEFAARWTAALTAPFVEETLKVCGVVFIYLIAREEMDDIMDGFVYGAMIGLGFAVVEDVFYFMSVFGGDPAGVLRGFFVRVVASGLYGHVLYTGVAGMGVAYFVTRRGERSFGRRAAVAAGAFGAATAAHVLWNSPVLDFFPAEPWTGAEWLLVLPAGAVKGLPFLGFVAVLVWLAFRREAAWLDAVMASEIGGDAITREEYQTLRNPLARIRSRRAMRARAGDHACRVLRDLQREQIDLAMVLTREGDIRSPEVTEHRRICASLRDALRAIPGAVSADADLEG